MPTRLIRALMSTPVDRDIRRYRGASRITSFSRAFRVSDGPYDSLPAAVDALRAVALRDGRQFKYSRRHARGKRFTSLVCVTDQCRSIDDDNADPCPCLFAADIRFRTATSEYWITRYIQHSYGCGARAPNVDVATRTLLLRDPTMLEISAQRGDCAIDSCIKFMRERFQFILDAPAAKSLLTHVRRHTSVAQRIQAVEHANAMQERQNVAQRLQTFVRHARELLQSMDTTAPSARENYINYMQLSGTFTELCEHSEHSDYKDICESWHLDNYDARLDILERAIRVAEDMARSCRDATHRQITALRNVRYTGDPYALSERQASDALRTLAENFRSSTA